jgi:hypothetical protein
MYRWFIILPRILDSKNYLVISHIAYYLMIPNLNISFKNVQMIHYLAMLYIFLLDNYLLALFATHYMYSTPAEY